MNGFCVVVLLYLWWMGCILSYLINRGGSMRAHLIPLRPLWIWQLYILPIVFAFTWPQWVERRKKIVEALTNALASVLEGQNLCIIFMWEKGEGLRWNPFTWGLLFTLISNFFFRLYSYYKVSSSGIIILSHQPLWLCLIRIRPTQKTYMRRK